MLIGIHMSDAPPDFPQLLPLDEHDIKLLQSVHPPDWTNPQPAERYNMVVIGGGTAGLVTASGAAGLGAKVALVERALLGGTYQLVSVAARSARTVGTFCDLQGRRQFVGLQPVATPIETAPAVQRPAPVPGWRRAIRRAIPR